VACCYPLAGAGQVEKNFVWQFKQKEVLDDIPEMRIETSEPIWIKKLMNAAGLVASKGEARHLSKQGGGQLHGEKPVMRISK
jgi:tyrosyl-tRNA synthetase